MKVRKLQKTAVKYVNLEIYVTAVNIYECVICRNMYVFVFQTLYQTDFVPAGVGVQEYRLRGLTGGVWEKAHPYTEQASFGVWENTHPYTEYPIQTQFSQSVPCEQPFFCVAVQNFKRAPQGGGIFF